MIMPVKNVLSYISIALVIFFIGFALSSGLALDISKKFSDRVAPDIKNRLCHHISTLEVDAKHYFLLPAGSYTIELYTRSLSYTTLAIILINSIFNILFQPVFFCVFTPQVILNAVLLPFFLYAAVRYFKKVWPLLTLFCILSFQIGVYDSGVEALIRHGMSCELIYLLVGIAGFTGWIARSS
jgi:hypothetical protein